jgi:hypothetical protein
MRAIKRDPQIAQAQKELHNDYYILSEMPEFQRVMAHLEAQTIYRKISKEDNLALLQGENNLILYIRGMIERGRKQRST